MHAFIFLALGVLAVVGLPAEQIPNRSSVASALDVSEVYTSVSSSNDSAIYDGRIYEEQADSPLMSMLQVPSAQTRIVGGAAVAISRYPMIAALLRSATTSNFRQRCGGTIINAWSIVTAAHCVWNDNAARWRVRVGSANANSGGRVVAVSRIRLHPSYRRTSFNADLAILRLSAKLSMSGNIKAARWAGSSYKLNTGTTVWAAGWGSTKAGGGPVQALRHVQLQIFNQNNCKRNYAAVKLTVNANMVCANWPRGGRDQCQGDSGGPLLHNGILVGIASFGKECGLSKYPGVNTRVSSFSSWITNNYFRS